MAQNHFTANGTWTVGVDAAADRGYRTVAYNGNLGGGTLAVSTNFGADVGDVPVPNAKMAAGKNDGNGDAIKQLVIQSAGNLKITLSGATNPDCWVAVF